MSVASGSPTPAGDPSAGNLRGMALMIFSMGVFILNDTLTKTAALELPTGQVVVIRSAFATLMMLPLVHFTSGLGKVFGYYSRPLLIRNLCEICSIMLYISALFRLPIANVTAILQVLPLAMTAAAALFLGERIGWRRWTAAAVGLIGVALIIRPGTAAFSWWYVSALIAVIFITTRDLITRFIDRGTPTLVVTLFTAAVGFVAGCLLGTMETWVVPRWATIGQLALASVLVLVGYYTLIESWRTGEVAAVAPFRYSVVLWAILFGYLLLGEVPDAWMLSGSAIVVAAGSYTFWREQHVRREAKRRAEALSGQSPSAPPQG